MTNTVALQDEFNPIYAAEADAIFRFCLIRVSDREQALDITQETFTRFWQSLQEGKKMSNARAFLFTIAHHLVIDWYRKKKSLTMGMMNDPDSGDSYDPPDESLEGDVKQGSEGRMLVESIGKLGAANRHAVYLRFVEGLSPPEIGEVLDISANAASVRITRGLTELRALLGYDVEIQETGRNSRSERDSRNLYE